MRLDFDFHAALGKGTIVRILVENEAVKAHLEKELKGLRILTLSRDADPTVPTARSRPPQ